MEKIIEVKNLTKTYKKAKKPSVDNVSFYVEDGAFFSLLGPNGAGKTTTISILTTLLSKTTGEVKIAGYDLEKEDSKVRRNIGVIFQNPSLDLNLTAEENIRFHCNLYGIYNYTPFFSLMHKDYREKVTKLADILGIKDSIFSPVKKLSGGTKRKLEIIRSLMHNPKVLFLDEPTTGLDPVSRQNLWRYLQEVRDTEKVTIFLTTHYLEEAEGSDYICILNNGKIVAKGTPQEIKETLVEKYLILDSANRDDLLRELETLNIKYTIKKNVHVDLENLKAQEIISKIKTNLNVLNVYNPTLEQAYVEIIKEDLK